MTRVRVAYVESYVREAVVEVAAPYTEGDLLAALNARTGDLVDVVAVEWYEQLDDEADDT